MKCIVKNCKNNTKCRESFISFHAFPTADERKRKWISALKLNYDEVKKTSVVCSLHFYEGDFMRYEKANFRRLFPAAVPHMKSNNDSMVSAVTPLDFDGSSSSKSMNFQTVCHTISLNSLQGKTASPSSIVPQLQAAVIPHMKSNNDSMVSAVTPLDFDGSSSSESMNFQTVCHTISLHSPQGKTGSHSSIVSPLETPMVISNALSLPRCTLKNAMYSEDDSSTFSTQNEILKKKLQVLRTSIKKRDRKIKRLNEKVRRQTNRLTTLKEVVKKIKSNNLINEETSEILQSLGDMNAQLFQRNIKKTKGQPIQKQYQPALRSFAMNLNFLSPKAYDYVRENFHNCLPHRRTIAKWYECVQCCPGFTKESFDAIAEVVQERTAASENVVLNLTFDEMAIRKHIDWSPKGVIGYSFIGEGDESNTEATQVLVFLVVCVNQAWKIPVGYFPIASLDARQKASLIQHCLTLLLETGAKVIGVTFDGTATNLTAAKLLGADLTDVTTPNVISSEDSTEEFCIIPDAVHMFKLVRNFFGEIGIIVDENGNAIKWEFLGLLVKLQEKEELHLGNKLRAAHIYFSNQKMKVSIAVQALSRSVADALDFCRQVLLLPEFKDCEATVQFIKMLNDIFDILNSSSIYNFGLKKAVCEDNIRDLMAFQNTAISYISKLRTTDGQQVIKHRRKTGFVGLIACLRNISVVYERFISTKILKYVPFYKLNQDHIELFFSSVRSHLGRNDNPSVKLFKAAYKKLIVRCQIREGGIGNCVPLERIEILNISSSNLIKANNIHSDGLKITQDIVGINDKENQFLNDHTYYQDPGYLSEYTIHVVKYIAGFVVFKMIAILNCDECIKELQGEIDKNSLVYFKSRGYLKIPSKSVEEVCNVTERELRAQAKVIDSNKSILNNVYYSRIIINAQKSFISKNIFQGHVQSSGHFNIIIKMIIEIYLKTRYFYIAKRKNETKTVRQKLHKVIHFRGM